VHASVAPGDRWLGSSSERSAAAVATRGARQGSDDAWLLCCGEPTQWISALPLTEDVNVNLEDCTRIVAEVLSDFVNRRPETQPR
jgi:hypothetical protein